MIGVTADLPVRDAPVITFTLPGANLIRCGRRPVRRGQRMSSLIWKYMFRSAREGGSTLRAGKVVHTKTRAFHSLDEVSARSTGCRTWAVFETTRSEFH